MGPEHQNWSTPGRTSDACGGSEILLRQGVVNLLWEAYKVTDWAPKEKIISSRGEEAPSIVDRKSVEFHGDGYSCHLTPCSISAAGKVIIEPADR